MQQHTDLLIRRLQSIGAVSPRDRAAIAALPIREREVWRGQTVRKEGEQPTDSILILSGLVSSFKVFPDGRRQIIGFHIAGDIPDLQSLVLPGLDFSLAAHQHADVALIAHDDLRPLLHAVPTLSDLCWRDTLVTASTYRTWVAAAGRLKVAEHFAHIICELHLRYQAVGLGAYNKLSLPLTDAELGDALGVTSTSARLAARQLENDGLIEVAEGEVRILDYERLQAYAQFEPSYLHVNGALV
ncbi:MULTISPECIES: Crp/Fnr family transcriptional regulator [unclassified Devosia]|uniref:Crp/Fnr family transcriptional regulator n=1 Tax=unclassified Devosia TaxID=196773 RepID=UPI00155308B7|nr:MULTISPECIES: Crp/Fnr family transcriptional regulator [unclassified Devosia]